MFDNGFHCNTGREQAAIVEQLYRLPCRRELAKKMVRDWYKYSTADLDNKFNWFRPGTAGVGRPYGCTIPVHLRSTQVQPQIHLHQMMLLCSDIVLPTACHVSVPETATALNEILDVGLQNSNWTTKLILHAPQGCHHPGPGLLESKSAVAIW